VDLAYLNINIMIYCCFEVCHLIVVVYRVHYKVRVVFPLVVEQFEEKDQGLLAEIVAEELNGHEVLVEGEGLGDLLEAEVVDRVVGHVEVHERLVLVNSLSHSLCSIVGSLVASQMKGLQNTALLCQVLGKSLASLSSNLIGSEVEHSEDVVVEKVLSDSEDTSTSQLVLLNGDLLNAQVVLEHLPKVNSSRLTYSVVGRVVDVKNFEGEVGAVKDREDSNDAIMVDVIVS
jgi:hypothetical protein